MERRITQISAAKDRKIKITMIPGHFVTSHSHVNAYVDLTEVKCESQPAQRAAELLAKDYDLTFPIETIVCMEGTELVGAYLAQELSKPGSQNPRERQERCGNRAGVRFQPADDFPR